MTVKNTAYIYVLLILLFSAAAPDKASADNYARIPGTEYLEIFAIGDAGRGNTDQVNTAIAMKNYADKIPVEFVLYLGDNCYSSGFSSIYDEKWKTRFEDIYDYPSLDVPFYAILGNHDYVGNEEAELQYSATFDTNFTLPSKYYSFSRILPDSTEIQFIMLDTIILVNGGQEADRELNWFENEISSSTADWKVVCGHYPLYSNGAHGNKTSLINMIEPLLINYNADLYIAGHDHDLELIKNETGPYYLISGSGALLREYSPGSDTVYGKKACGVAVLRFSSDELIIMILLEDNTIDFSLKITK